jgi:hypothetical protein
MARIVRFAAAVAAASLVGLVLAFAPELTAVLVGLAYGSFVVALAWRVGGLVQPEPVEAATEPAPLPAPAITPRRVPARAARVQR